MEMRELTMDEVMMVGGGTEAYMQEVVVVGDSGGRHPYSFLFAWLGAGGGAAVGNAVAGVPGGGLAAAAGYDVGEAFGQAVGEYEARIFNHTTRSGFPMIIPFP